MARPLMEIEADLAESYRRLETTKAEFKAYLYGVILGTMMGLCSGFLLGAYWNA